MSASCWNRVQLALSARQLREFLRCLLGLDCSSQGLSFHQTFFLLQRSCPMRLVAWSFELKVPHAHHLRLWASDRIRATTSTLPVMSFYLLFD